MERSSANGDIRAGGSGRHANVSRTIDDERVSSMFHGENGKARNSGRSPVFGRSGLQHEMASPWRGLANNILKKEWSLKVKCVFTRNIK